MIPFDPVKPRAPQLGPLRVHRAQPVTARLKQPDAAPKDRRNRTDRRKNKFSHRGAFEMRTGDDRRGIDHIDEEV